MASNNSNSIPQGFSSPCKLMRLIYNAKNQMKYNVLTTNDIILFWFRVFQKMILSWKPIMSSNKKICDMILFHINQVTYNANTNVCTSEATTPKYYFKIVAYINNKMEDEFKYYEPVGVDLTADDYKSTMTAAFDLLLEKLEHHKSRSRR